MHWLDQGDALVGWQLFLICSVVVRVHDAARRARLRLVLDLAHEQLPALVLRSYPHDSR